MPDAPRAELLRGLAVMAEVPGPQHATLAEALGLPGVPTASEYSDVFLFQLYPYASVHLGPEGMMGGEARDRIAGFWRALGLSPPAEPDHLAALVGLYASLLEREAGTPDEAERALLSTARAALLIEHLAPWIFLFLERIRELAGPHYAAWAVLLSDALHAEITESGSGEAALSSHLRAAPPLPDPREEGSEAFLQGLLAPVRAGAILTRADLAAVAGELDMGLRAGERRYALEHLLAQGAEGLLRSLAPVFRRQGAFQAAWADRVATEGSAVAEGARFLARRAEETSDLLELLADESARSSLDFATTG